jgi:UDP-2,3-diacylglucosamine hydrolase
MGSPWDAAMSSLIAPSTFTILADQPPPPTPIGLIAGGGRLPIMIARALRKGGHVVHGLGLSKQFDPDLPELCNTFQEVGVLRIGSWGRSLTKLNIRHAIMVGKVDKAKLMHDPWRLFRHVPDWRTAKLWLVRLRRDRRSWALLNAVADELDHFGVTLLDSTIPIGDAMADIGVMTQRQPTADQRADVEFVWPLLSQALRLDIGQSIAVRERDVIAVEAVEGTDRMIERAGQICRAKGWTLCKGARAGHDRRSDVPTVGVNTIRNLAANGGGCLALAASEVIMVDKAHMIELADELGISIVGVPASVAETSSTSVFVPEVQFAGSL